MHPASRDSLLERLNKVTITPDVTGESDVPPSSVRHDFHANGVASGSGIQDDEEDGTDDEKWEDAQETFTEDTNATSPILDPKVQLAELQEVLAETNKLKEDGNNSFRESNWKRALLHYEEGIRILPPRPPAPISKDKEVVQSDSSEEDSTPAPISKPPDETASELADGTRDASSENDPLKLAKDQCGVVRSILHANIAACHIKMGDHEKAVASCTESLIDVPTYSKALHRRATSNEIIGTWTSLSQADQDYKTLLRTLPADSPLLRSVRIASQKLGPRLEQQQKKETDEMLGKLREVGDNILGRFGLSTENFKFTPNGQGGYSMNFVQ